MSGKLERLINHKVSVMKNFEVELRSLSPEERKECIISNLKKLHEILLKESRKSDFKAKVNFATNILLNLSDQWWKWFALIMECIKDEYKPHIWNLIITAMTGEPLNLPE